MELGPKQLQLLQEMVPSARRVALLVNPDSQTLADKQTSDQQAAARALGLELDVLHARAVDDFDHVFAAAQTSIVVADMLATSHSTRRTGSSGGGEPRDRD
jgi:ABC-type uncharacterized transport system substrate-binding protein